MNFGGSKTCSRSCFTFRNSPLPALRKACARKRKGLVLIHILFQKGQRLFGVAAEPVVAVLEAFRRALDPVKFLVAAGQGVKGTLGVGRILDDGVVVDLPHENGELDVGRPQLARHVGGGETSQLEEFQVDEFLVLADALGPGQLGKDRRHVGHEGATHAADVVKQLGPLGDGCVLRNATQALTEQGLFHAAEARVCVNEAFYADAVAPLPLADT